MSRFNCPADYDKTMCTEPPGCQNYRVCQSLAPEPENNPWILEVHSVPQSSDKALAQPTIACLTVVRYSRGGWRPSVPANLPLIPIMQRRGLTSSKRIGWQVVRDDVAHQIACDNLSNLNLQYNDSPIVAVQFDNDRLTPNWLITADAYEGNDDGWLVIVEGDDVIVEDGCGKTDGDSIGGIYWTADGYEFSEATWASAHPCDRIDMLSAEQIERIHDLLRCPTEVDETMWCTVCCKHTYPEDAWSQCGHIRWNNDIGCWTGIGDAENVSVESDGQMAALLALCESLSPQRYYVSERNPETGKWGFYKESPAGGDRLRWVLDRGKYEFLTSLLDDLEDEGVDEEHEDVGLLITWLMTLDEQDETPSHWQIAKSWLDAVTQGASTLTPQQKEIWHESEH